MAMQPNLSNPTAGRAPAGRSWIVFAAAVALFPSGCAFEFRNAQPAQELARQAQPPGSVYVGWRVYQDRCARCHGASGGGATAPDLLPKLRTMGPQRFVDLVLRRYEWGLPVPAYDGPAREALVADIVQRRAGALTMPAWQGEPRVNAHIVDLHAYLSARAQGTRGPGRPVP